MLLRPLFLAAMARSTHRAGVSAIRRPGLRAIRRLALCAAVCAVVPWTLSSTPAAAQVPYREAPAIPPALEAYRGWVLHDHKDLLCAALGEAKACQWPGLLTLEVGEGHARWALEVWLDTPGRVALPGDAQRLPTDVRDGEQPALVVRDSAGLPSALLLAGHHKLSGRFDWASAPETLPIPAEVAAIVLNALGKQVPRPRREGGQLWLGQQERSDEGARDSLRVRVFRRLDDGVPLRLTTRLEVQAAGRARDVAVGLVLPAGSTPTALDGGGLPAVIGDDGALRLHVRPGSYTVTIGAVMAGDPSTVPVPAHASATGIEEIEAWAWFADETVRSAELSGLTPVDPTRAGLPTDWHGGNSLLARQGEALVIKTLRRGMAEAAPDRLTLHRDLWLDLDGGGLTARDQIDGTMHRAFRVDFASSGGRLGRVHDGKAQRDALITTRQGEDGSPRVGVELRDSEVKLRAESRLEGAIETLPAVGWDLDPQELKASLHLPPGWRLLAAEGVDRAPNTWLASWTLLDFFLVLMVALATGKLFGPIGGVLALVTTVICHGEEDAPAWIWVWLLALTALLRVLPEGWLRRIGVWLRVLCGGALLVMAIPFAILQIRHGVYPQVSVSSGFGAPFQIGSLALKDDDRAEQTAVEAALVEEAQDAPMAKAAEAPAQVQQQAEQGLSESMGGAVEAASSNALYGFNSRGPSRKQAKADWSKAERNLVEVDPKAVVQTGFGVPSWQGSTWSLEWSGPVRHDHTMRLWLQSPLHGLLLALLRVALMLALAVQVLELRAVLPSLRALLARSTGMFGGTAALLLTLGAMALLGAPSAWAQSATDLEALASARPLSGAGFSTWPPSEALDALRDRLIDAESCHGPCTTTPSATLRVDAAGAVTLQAEVHVLRAAGWAIPTGMQIGGARVDGQVSSALRREADGTTWLRLPAGRHAVEVEGLLPAGASVALAFEAWSRPGRLRVEAGQWRVDGLDPDGIPRESLQLSRVQPEAGATVQERAAAEVPDWFTVERRLLIGLPWRVETVVVRQRPGQPTLVELPLLAGEAVLSEGVRVEEKGGRRVALLALERDVDTVSLSSQLAVSPAIALTAPRGVPWTETWHVECSPIWRCQGDGVLPVQRVDGDRRLRPTYRPWPGEALTLKIDRPAGAEGQALTIDAVRFDVTPGQRLLAATLDLDVRASQGAIRKLTLPADAELQKVRIGGKDRALQLERGVLHLPIEPGAAQVHIAWQQPWERAAVEALPTVDIGGPAVNVRTTLHLGDDRWLLFARGPSWGPAVLFWSHLAVLLLLALMLSRLRGLPLRPLQWLLLCIGFANIGTPPLLIFVGWLIALSWRRQHFSTRPSPEQGGLFDLVQLGLVAATVAALGALYAAIHSNLLLDVDMQVEGAGSSNNHLTWYVDRVGGPLPDAAMISLPLWVFRVAMLLWSLWLVSALLRWLPWAFRCWSDGGIWRPMTATKRSAAEPSAVPPADDSGAFRPSGPARDDLPPPPAAP